MVSRFPRSTYLYSSLDDLSWSWRFFLLGQAGSSIHDGVTRFNLVYKSNPGEAASASMAKEMGGFCQQMVSSFT